MKLLFKQRFFSWFDSYDIFDEYGEVVFVVKGQISWGHCLKIYDAAGYEVGTVQEKLFRLLPEFEFYEGPDYIGRLKKQFTFFTPKYDVIGPGWFVQGNFFEWDYDILSSEGYGGVVASVSKELFHFTDTYTIDVMNPQDALLALMVVLAIDAEKCSRDD